jgi:hypothetical protein
MADENRCADAEHVAAWRKFMEANPEFSSVSSANVFAHAFREGMKFMQERQSSMLKAASDQGFSRGWVAGRDSLDGDEC